MNLRLLEIASNTGRLAAVLHSSPPGAPCLGAVLVPPAGACDRAGPRGLATRLARRLSEAGYAVLRYDGAGLGESPGRAPSWSKAGLSAALRRGDTNDDVIAAAEALRHEAGCDALAVLALGEGVYSAVHLARTRPDVVAAILAVGAPLLGSTGLGRSIAARWGPASRRHAARRYALRATDPEAWRRLWRGDSNVGAILGALDSITETTRASTPLDPRGDDTTLDDLARLATSGTPVALAWGHLDPRRAAFEDRARPSHKRALAIHSIRGAGATCSETAAFEELARIAIAFLDDRAARTPRNETLRTPDVR